MDKSSSKIFVLIKFEFSWKILLYQISGDQTKSNPFMAKKRVGQKKVESKFWTFFFQAAILYISENISNFILIVNYYVYKRCFN